MKTYSLLLAICLFAVPAQAQHVQCNAPTVACGQQIVVATFNEFPVLANDGMNADSMEQLLRRMIWHLQLNGIQAARQKNPSGRISQDKLSALIDGQWRVYDVLSDRADPGPFRVGFDEVPGANPQPNDPNGPIADEGVGPAPEPDVPPTGSTSVLDAVRDEARESAARDAGLLAQVEALRVDVFGVRESLEAHRDESRKTRSAVLGFLGNWRNYVKMGLAGLGTWGTIKATDNDDAR